ncbi:MAG: DnaB-like helicase C-terminal domain-containing protein [Melioribacteraceae bacterium]
MDGSTEIQVKLLGAYMCNSDLFSGIDNLVRPNIFTTPVTKKSYEIIKAYHNKNILPDKSLLWSTLNKSGISQSESSIVASYDVNSFLPEEQVKEYVETLFYDYAGKYLAPFMQQFILNKDSSDPIQEMIKVKDAITNVELALNGVSKEKSVKDQFKEAVQRIKDLKTGSIQQTGFSWGIKKLDEMTLGIVQGINVVAAGKGEGKSTLIVNVIVENVIKKQLPMLFFSMEMTAVEVLTNVIANVRKINSKALRMGSVEDEDILNIEQLESRLNESFVIDATGGITHQYFAAKVREFRKKNNIPYSQTILVALDYLGLMKNSPDEAKMNKEEKIEHICTELMSTCKNENIALLKLAQFSRERDRRGNDSYAVKNDADKLKALRPIMSDLKGSSAIESNAVTILFLFRPEYHRILECNGTDFKGLCEINIAKGRYVSPEPVYVRFTGKYSLFEDLEESGIRSDDGSGNEF